MSKLLVLAALCLTALPAFGQAVPAETAKTHFNRGLAFLRAEKYDDALTEFRAAARLNPRSAETQGNIGAVLMLQQKPAEAITAFREAVKLSPTEGSFHSALCTALVATGKSEEAIKSCEEGIRLQPDSDYAHASLFNAMIEAERPDAEIGRLLSLALSRFVDSVNILEAAVNYYLAIHQYQAATEVLDQLIRLRPSAAVYHGKLALALVRLERDAEAITAARKALELEPNNPYANYSMGRLFLELGQHGDAAQAFKKAAGVKGLDDAQFFLAMSESRLGRAENAIEAFKTALRDDPDNYRTLFEYGSVLISASRFEEAVVHLRRAVALKPKDFEAKVSLGLALFESAQFPEGIAVLEEVDRMKPGNDIIAMFLRVARSRQQSIPKIDEMKRYAKENPRDIGVRVELIQLLAFARRIGEAEPYLQQFLELQPKEIRLYQSVAVAYSTAGDNEKALAIYRKSMALGEDFGTYAGLAGIYREQGKSEEASAAYAKVLALKAEVPGIMKLYADHLRDYGKRREALEMYKRSLALQPTFGPTLSSAAIVAARLGEMDTARQYLATLKSVDPEIARMLERCLVAMRNWQ